MKLYPIVVALVSLLCLNLSAAELVDRGEIVIDPKPMHFKVMAMSYDTVKGQAFVRLAKHCTHNPNPHPGPCEPNDPNCHGGCPGIKLMLNMSDKVDNDLYDFFLSLPSCCGCKDRHHCHCKCVQILFDHGKVIKVAKKACGCSHGPCPSPAY